MPYVSSRQGLHDSFLQPEDGSIKIWRYLDLTRLVVLLSCARLPLTRVDLLRDDFEGSVTRGVYEAWKGNPRNAEIMARIGPEFRRATYVSSWHTNNQESEAMWRLYCGEREGIALQTTYEKLDCSLPPSVHLGRVTYCDFEATDLPSAWLNMFTRIMHKRLAFEHEREVRVVAWRSAMLLAEGTLSDDLPSDEPDVITIPWNAADTLEHVFVSPYAPAWYRDVVAAVLERFAPELSSRIEWSQMKGTPRY